MIQAFSLYLLTDAQVQATQHTAGALTLPTEPRSALTKRRSPLLLVLSVLNSSHEKRRVSRGIRTPSILDK